MTTMGAMRNCTLAALVGLSLSACSKHHSPLSAMTPHNSSILIMGQSNAVGVYTHALQTLEASIARETGGSVRVVSCAVNGSRIRDWQPGAIRLEDCMTTFQNDKFDAVIWWQGEAEGAVYWEDAPMWADLFRKVISSTRARLHSPSLPFIFVQIGPNVEHTAAWVTVQNQQASMLGMSGLSMVSAKEAESDGSVHYTDAGYQFMAVKLAEAFTGKGGTL